MGKHNPHIEIGDKVIARTFDEVMEICPWKQTTFGTKQYEVFVPKRFRGKVWEVVGIICYEREDPITIIHNGIKEDSWNWFFKKI